MTEPSSITEIESFQKCKCCLESVSESDQFCTKCGFPLKGTDAQQKIFLYQRDFRKIDAQIPDRNIKSARNTLYVLAGLFFIYAVAFYFLQDEKNVAILISYAIVAALFFVLGKFSSKKPVASIISGIALYVLLQLIAFFENPRNILSGLFIKILIVVYLVNGLKSALKAQKQHNI